MGIDFSSATWAGLTEQIKTQIEAARGRLEGDLDLVETAGLRGEIRALKRLLAMPETAAREQEIHRAHIQALGGD